MQRSFGGCPQLPLPAAYEEARAISLEPNFPSAPQSGTDSQREAESSSQQDHTSDASNPREPHVMYPEFEVRRARRQLAATYIRTPSVHSISSVDSRLPDPAPEAGSAAEDSGPSPEASTSTRPRVAYHHRPDWKLRLLLVLVRTAEVTNAPWMFGNGNEV